ncbi:Rha family transcriptional regulator [Aureimonas altamirensis]|uniref:Rha family transcriptional regulator n=1 Tax=Aureimonas altamirensis TaxID=370622 RepID=UPI001E2F5D29|nr:Rha family transcriptional regulator [Aureimonas altamirensis]UHD46601.1 Rha family transcriptional regulator [Aureimonas altamirensis]
MLRDLENLRSSLIVQDWALWFHATTYEAGEGWRQRKYPSVDMTKDGFTLLVMGFTGHAALAFKVAYINRFNEMQDALRKAEPRNLPKPEPMRSSLEKADYARIVAGVMQGIGSALLRQSSMVSEPAP